MARPLKIGLEYFPHDTNLYDDSKIKFLRNKNGILGYVIFLRLLEEIYKGKGYYVENDENFTLTFPVDNYISQNEYNKIIKDCLDIKLFDKNIYEKYKILTSKRIQETFLTSTTRRKKVELMKHLTLLKDVNVYINLVIVDINAVNVDISTQIEIEREIEKEIESKKKVKRNEIEIESRRPLMKILINEIISLTGNTLFTVEKAILKSDVKDMPENILEKAINNIKKPNDFLKSVHLNFYTKPVNIEDLANGKYLPVDEKEEENKKYKPLVM